MKKSIFIVLIFSILLNVSCSTDETCTQSKYVKFTAGFYHPHFNDTTKVLTVTSLQIDSLTIQGMKYDTLTHKYNLIDSLLYNNNKSKLSSINLPLNNFATQSMFRFTLNSVVDTVTIYHTYFNNFLSLECGCIVTHSIDTVITTHHYIDSVQIKIRDVNTTSVENLRIYNHDK